jgi:hypothetical protein
MDDIAARWSIWAGLPREVLALELGDRCVMWLVAENNPWMQNPIKRAHDAMVFLQRRSPGSLFPSLSRREGQS